MVRKYLLLLAIAFGLLLAGCRFGKPVAPTQSVYATAYTILTQTAEAEARLPTRPAIPLPTASATQEPSDEVVTPNTPATVVQVGQVTSVQATADTRSSQVPINTRPPLATATIFPAGGGSPGVVIVSPTPTELSIPPTSTPVIPAPTQGVVGVWQQKITGSVLNFNQDGSYQLADSFTILKSETVDEGQYTTQNDQVTLNGSSQSAFCRNLSANYQFSAALANERIFTLVADACYERQRTLPREGWYWLPVKPEATPVSPDAEEIPVEIVPLGGALANGQASITGLDWYGDKLLFLPTDPRFSGNGSANLYWIGLETIVDYLNDFITGPINPQAINLNDTAVLAQLNGFQGYQAILVNQNQVYLLIQADPGNGQRSYLVSGSISSDANLITLDASRLFELPVQVGSTVRTYRSIVRADSEVLVIPDVGGSGLNNSPAALRYDANLNYLGTIPMSAINYLITDATSLGSGGRIWVVNKFAPGDPGAITSADPLVQLYGEGVTHQAFDYVERLIAYQYTGSSLALAAIPPLQMELSAYGPRNWQGIASLGDQGVLVVTNQTPGTLLGYIPFP